MVATVKIIPFSLPAHVVETAEQAISGSPEPLIAVAAFTPHNAHLILTELPGSKPSVIEKRRQALLKRLEAAGSTLSATEIVPHDEQAVAAAIDRAGKTGADPILVFGASAIVDRKDVIPAGIEASGGTVRHLGMPVDPGNLLLLGDRGGRTVIGVPSCASSPKINGLDWVLERTLANLAISDADIAAMSVGGLLMEIQSRPQPREGSGPTGKRHTPRIAAVVLAAGRSTRMGTNNKLLEKLDGRSLVSHAVDAARQSRAGHIVVVTGHEADAVRTELDGTAVNFTHNPGYAEGLATSLATGLAALPNGIDGAVVLLGDMPGVDAKIIDKLIAAFAPDDHRGICVPTTGGQRGNPVLWAHRYFAEMKNLKGDIGAKALLGVHAEDVAEVAIDSDAILTDIDTPEALAIARSSP
ncbi:MAG TPA: NTP transferase domain-containing protein [Hyphomicrobiaceae bacterium]|nr:NTP transferase domain-containing protein [Hyphomicrobiaceae bacterium]